MSLLSQVLLSAPLLIGGEEAPSVGATTGSTAISPREPGEPGALTGLALRARKALLCAPAGPQVLDDAVVLVRDGRIEAVAAASELEVPPGYVLHDLGERWLMPGMVELHCHIAGPNLFQINDINDMVYLTNPGLRISPAVIPNNAALQRAVASGVTSVLYIPGSGTNMGGQGVLLKTGLPTYEAMEIRNPGSLKLAQAGNPERFLIGVGRSFMNWNTRDTFVRGVAYAKRWEVFENGTGERPEVNLQFEIFRNLYKREAQVSTHTQIYQVVNATLSMVAEELDLPVFIDHGSFDGWRAAPRAEELGVPAIVGPRGISRTRLGPVDTDGQIQGIAAKFQEQGHTRIGFNTDSPVIPQEELSSQAALGVRYGFDPSGLAHVRGLTIVPAETAGVADRVGSLEPGKHADLLVVTGDPTDPRTAVETVWIEGQKIYDVARDRRRW